MVSKLEVEERLNKMLTAQNLTMDQFKKRLQAEKQSYDQVFSDMHRRLIIQKLFQKAMADKDGGSKQLKEEDVKAFYEKLRKDNPIHLTAYRVQHIIFR